MGAAGIPSAGDGLPAGSEVEDEFRRAGLAPRTWSNGPGAVYATHAHGYHKRLVCVAGAVTFHTPDGDFVLQAGDRLELDPHTPHSATVGPAGVTCVEAAIPCPHDDR